MDKSLLLVGSMPLETVEEVFRTVGGPLSPYLQSMPDGEVGERQYWISMLYYRVFHGHPEIETVSRPAPIDGVEQWRAKGGTDNWRFKVREGVSQVRFGDPGWRLGYAKEAINSYFIFRTLREQGVIAPGVRFQVGIPSVHSTLMAVFPAADYERVAPGFEIALQTEIAKITEKIPPRDLAIQWDCCIEVLDLEGMSFAAPAPLEVKLHRYAEPMSRLSPQLPADALLGYHLCYGSLGRWPMLAPPADVGRLVDFANELVSASGRRVDYLHLPIARRSRESYLAPLGALRSDGLRVYLGVIHDMEDRSSFRTGVALARKYLPDFGVAGPCGYAHGQAAAADVPAIVRDHLTALKILSQT